MNLTLGSLVRSDAELLTLQGAAYQSEAVQYRDPCLPPLVQSVAELIVCAFLRATRPVTGVSAHNDQGRRDGDAAAVATTAEVA